MTDAIKVSLGGLWEIPWPALLDRSDADTPIYNAIAWKHLRARAAQVASEQVWHVTPLVGVTTCPFWWIDADGPKHECVGSNHHAGRHVDALGIAYSREGVERFIEATPASTARNHAIWEQARRKIEGENTDE